MQPIGTSFAWRNAERFFFPLFRGHTMRLESALFSSRSGIDAHGLAIGVVGDNIANVSTNGFKAARAEFQDMLSDGYDGRASYAGPEVGNGTSVPVVRPIQRPGSTDQTGRDLDAAIDGNGFFLVGSAETPRLTRDGAFSLDQQGFLITNTGQRVLGYAPGGQELTDLNLRAGVTLLGVASTAATITGNLPSDAVITAAPADPASFTELAQAAAYQTSVKVYDSLGAEHPITLSFFRTGPNTWTAQAHVDGGDLQGGTAGTPTQIGANATLAFNTNGTIEPANQAAATLTITPTFANGSAAGNVAINVSNFVQMAAPGSTTSIDIDGQPAAQVVSYDIKPDGTIEGILSSGSPTNLGTIALGNVRSVDGLQRVGDNDFGETTRSGALVIARPATGALGAIAGRSLELSTTDISREFTNLVLIQRGYEANSKILNSTSDMMRQTIQLLA